MNINEFCLEEIELQSSLVVEGLSALLHTILFVRAPGKVEPTDYVCRSLAPLIFAKCGPSDVDQTISDAIGNFERVRVQISPTSSRGDILVTFYEKSETQGFLTGFFGFSKKIEKIPFERWRIPIIVDERPVPRKQIGGRDSADVNDRLQQEIDVEQRRICDSARMQVQQRILTILETVNRSIDHVPPTMYEYAIEATGPSGERNEQSTLARLINAPPNI